MYVDCPHSGFTCNSWDYDISAEEAAANNYEGRNYGYCVDWQDRVGRSGATPEGDDLRARLEERKIALTLDDKALDWLAQRGYDPVYGARPLKRVIQKEVQDPLAERILSGSIEDGDTVRVTPTAERLVFERIDGAGVAEAA